MEVQIENDKIFAPLKGKWLVLKPEEEVRQTYICRLVDYYGYRLSQMDQEIQVNNSQRGQGMARADIVIWRNEQDKSDHKTPLIVVECKAENVTIRQADYFQGYNYAGWAGADFFVTTNLKETRIFKVDKSKMPKELDEIADIPKADIGLSRYLVGAEAISVCLKVILLASQTDYNGISIISIGTGCTPIRDTCTL